MLLPSDTATLDRALECLRAAGLEVTDRSAASAAGDRRIHVAKDESHSDYVVAIKRRVLPSTLGMLTLQLRHLAESAGAPALLVAPHVTAPVAEALAKSGQQFADAAGNAWLDAPGLFVWITGRKPERAEPAVPPGRAFTTVGLKTLFALLCRPELAAAPYREIAASAGVALGAIPAILQDLQRDGHLARAGRIRRLLPTRRLLDSWTTAFATTLRPKLLLRTLVAQDLDGWQGWDLREDAALWGSEPAARRLVGHLRPGMLTIYARALPTRLMVKQRLTVASSSAREGRVEIRQMFWGEGLAQPGEADTVHPLLVYADLLATGEARCIETARMIHDKHLAGLFG